MFGLQKAWEALPVAEVQTGTAQSGNDLETLWLNGTANIVQNHYSGPFWVKQHLIFFNAVFLRIFF